MNKKTAFALLLGLLAASGVWLLKISSPAGLGLTDDAISYIAAARALLRGQGFTRIWLASGLEPITHWPPLFPATIAAVGKALRIDPYRSARVVNILIYGANTALLGWLGWRMTRSRWAGFFLSVLFLSNHTFLRLHVYALSEPLYLFLSLLAFLSLAEYFERGKTKWLIAAGALSGLSYLTRYAALSLLATCSVAFFVFLPDWRKRISSVAVYWASALPIMLAWMLRNELIGGSATNRAMQWHPLTADNLQRGIDSLTRFLIPVAEWWFNLRHIVYGFEGLLFWISAPIFVWIVWVGGRSFFKPNSSERPEPLAFLHGLYIFGYMGSLIFSISFFDAATPLIDRILSPVYLSLLVILVSFGAWIWQRKKSLLRLVVISAAIFILSVSLTAQCNAVQELQETAQGFASWRWRESTVMEAIRALPEDVTIYTNQQPAVYFWTDRPGVRLPTNAAELAEMQEALANGKAVLAIFNQNWSPETEREIQKLSAGLDIIRASGLGDLYGNLP